MPKIKKLSEALTSQIAAGEVVERPASVVKELVENSLDASARSIFVFIERSGKDRIRVSDDGVGMEAADARLALERHATSKLSSASDLTGITTLGFRGEALPSIASVSHLTLRSRAQGGAIGHELVLEGGKLVREGEIGLPEGTLVDVRRLFYSVPARRKFLRADVTEASHIAALISNLAASFPQVQFRLEHGKRTILNAPSASSRRERLYQIEKSWVESAIHLEESAGSLHIDAWLSPPAASRGAASRIHLFVNGRPVKDRVLTHAVMEAYRQAFSKTGTPLLYLFLELPPEKVDVNVHPAKAEVRFVDQRFVHHAVFTVLRNALQGEGRAPELPVALEEAPRAAELQSGPAVGEAKASYRGGSPFPSIATRTGGGGGSVAEALFSAPSRPESPAFAEFATSPPALLGQFRQSFIVAADGDSLWLLDQHAAHERILFEELLHRQEGEGIAQQLLLTPLHIELSPAERLAAEEELPRLVTYGFDIEPFGGGSFVIRAVPSIFSGLDIAPLVRAGLTETEQDCPTSSVSQAQERIAARIACHAAIKIHTELAPEKMRFILTRLWQARQPTVCPHGRPTTLRLGREQVERSFGRI